MSTLGTSVSDTALDIYLDCNGNNCKTSYGHTSDYRMDIETWPSDAGNYGDTTTQFGTGLSTWDDGSTYVGMCGQYGAGVCEVNMGANDGNDQATKTIAAGESFANRKPASPSSPVTNPHPTRPRNTQALIGCAFTRAIASNTGWEAKSLW